ncbi:ferrichrome-binding protein [Haladaptatus litoreus]|uniref:Ferrichrome-binding protein n=1 Tax=Haladaptatus litoreus TaxID=553468 RepID=A0A1N7E0W1_9EURY|nr:ABC transporter substrate-binding protein [Haladaptatus litoreus]SIR81681.1 ferrichrome-binding protein [Haladaptatus litoreus]
MSMVADESKPVTRRRFITGSGVASAALLAGCTSGNDDSDETQTSTGGTGDGDGGTGSDGTTTQSGPYSVSMEPVGEVEFESVPETWLTYEAGYADMGVALGMGDSLQAIGLPSRFHTQYYDELSGVSMDKSSLTTLYSEGVDREIFFQLDSDVHLIDPNWLVNNSAFGLEQQDVDQIGSQVAPFFGNTIFRRTDSWHDYQYYTMYEAFGKIAKVFKQEERYQQFKSFHDDYISGLQSELPAESDRPSAMLLWQAENEPMEFSPYRLSDKGTNKKQWHDLGVKDALDGTGIEGLSTTERGTVDYETLLEVDPEVILLRGHETKSKEEFQNTVVSFMKNHNVASDLQAVKNDRVFRGGPIYQGPIINLFTTESAATSLYPDTFSGKLFDREKVADIITG